jgi:eukaryotic-like serine/threonine-protein kinase
MSMPPSGLTEALMDRYRIARELGVGGMATVYLAEDLKHGRNVAVKVLRTDIADVVGRDRFEREIRLAARLTHPHILPLYDSGEAGGFLFYVMPVMAGQTVRDLLNAEQRLSMDVALRIASEVADALDYAHRHDIVHRDIKPENILLHEGHALVADFGIGKAVAAASHADGALTQIGVTVGTPAYMSPEQAAGEDLDGRSDLFALGCVLYEMLTGEVAFTGASVPAIIAKRFVHSPPSVTSTRAEVPSTISAIVERLLAKEVAVRYATGHEVAVALRTPSAPAPVAVRPARSTTERAIAVLPFTNMSADAENAYFSDGLTEEIITALSRVQALRVTSRTSSMQHKGSTLGVREIGRALDVQYVLTGSVRRAGNALRISAQLVAADEDRQLWGETFNGTMDDVFDVQERVAREIVGSLGVTLRPEEDQRLASRGIVHAAAFELYLEARDEIRRFTSRPEIWNALLDRAVAIEGNTPVLRGLRLWGEVALLKMGVGDHAQMDALEHQARALISEASDAPWGYAALAYVHFERGEMTQAIIAFRAAITRDPTDSESRYWLTSSYGYAGLLDLAEQSAAEMKASDPLSPMSWTATIISPFFGGDIGSSIPTLRHASAMDPQNYVIRWCLAYAYMAVSEFDAADAELSWMGSIAADGPYTVQLVALQRVLRGQRAEGLAMVEGLNLAPFDSHLTFHIAEVYAMAGEVERGLEVAALGVRKGFTPAAFIGTHCPFVEPLRSHARFADIVAEATAKSDAMRRSVEGRR